MHFVTKLAATLLLAAACALSYAGTTDIGMVVIHGKWGSPRGPVAPLARALEREGFIVSVPEMPWSAQRVYDRSVEDTEADIDRELAKLREAGAKHVFVIGHSLGAAFTLRFATRHTPSGIVAVAPGHRPEGSRYAQAFREPVSTARALTAAGRGTELVGFTDLNTGGRQSYLRAPAGPFLSYFDPSGPLHMARNAASVKADVPVLWIVPAGEEQPLRSGLVGLFRSLPKHPLTKFVEPEGDHLGAPAASARAIVDWIREVAAKN